MWFLHTKLECGIGSHIKKLSYSATWKATCLPRTLNGSWCLIFFFFFKYMYHVLVIWKTVHWVLETIWMWSHLITKINKSHSLVSPPILSENLKVLRKLLSSQWRTHVFSNSYFHSKELNYWQHILSLVSLKITGSFYLQKKKRK